MSRTDSNEVHAWLRSTNDLEGLQELQDHVNERLDKFSQAKVGVAHSEAPNVQPSDGLNTAGPLAQPLTGPSPPLGRASDIHAQATQNEQLFNDQVASGGRVQGPVPVTVNVDSAHAAETPGPTQVTTAEQEEALRAARHGHAVEPTPRPQSAPPQPAPPTQTPEGQGDKPAATQAPEKAAPKPG